MTLRYVIRARLNHRALGIPLGYATSKVRYLATISGDTLQSRRPIFAPRPPSLPPQTAEIASPACAPLCTALHGPLSRPLISLGFPWTVLDFHFYVYTRPALILQKFYHCDILSPYLREHHTSRSLLGWPRKGPPALTQDFCAMDHGCRRHLRRRGPGAKGRVRLTR